MAPAEPTPRDTRSGAVNTRTAAAHAAGIDPAHIRAITLDLDDTLWPIAPVMARVEQRVDAWLHAHCPEVAAAWPIEAMRALRETINREHPEYAHDYTMQRKLTLRRAFAPFGFDEDWVEAAYAIYQHERNCVDCYADAEPALARLAARLPLVSLSNGNADLARIGLDRHFRFSISAREVGVAKPDPQIFLHACERLGLAPHQVLHVGDDPALDVVGARAVGMPAAWINRAGLAWHDDDAPALHFRDLDALADWIEAHTLPPADG